MKKNNIKKITIITILILILTTGCTKTLVDKNKKPVKNPENGQNLVQNILCQPKDKKTIELYEKNKVDIKKLPTCDEFKITSGKYEGIWTSFFVKPLSFIILKIGMLTKNYGIALILVLLLIKLITFPFTKKTIRQSQLMQQINPEIQKIQKKYEGKQDEASLSKQSQEMMMIYKKYNINPIGGCLVAFIQLPIFIAFYEAVQRFPAIFEDTFLKIQLGTTPLVGFKASNFYLYIILMILIAVSTIYSFKINMSGQQMDKSMKSMPIIMSIMIIFTAFFMPSALCIYWIFNNIFSIIQTKLLTRNKDNNTKVKVKGSK